MLPGKSWGSKKSNGFFLVANSNPPVMLKKMCYHEMRFENLDCPGRNAPRTPLEELSSQITGEEAKSRQWGK